MEITGTKVAFMLRWILSGLCISLLATAAAAEGPQQRPCQADLQKYCADARGDRDKMGQCMKQHFNDFSAACQARIKERENGRGGGDGGSWHQRPPSDPSGTQPSAPASP